VRKTLKEKLTNRLTAAQTRRVRRIVNECIRLQDEFGYSPVNSLKLAHERIERNYDKTGHPVGKAL
jgi:hypothetical protein